jgi:hypothetical protein
MNLDELMAVWRTQDAAPLHDMNKTLLHLALRQDEAKLQKARRRDRLIIYVVSVGLIVGMALFLANMIGLMIYRYDMNGLTGWDLVVPVIGGVAALISVRAAYSSHRAQSRREQRFGDSLRDQLNRNIAQLDDAKTTARRTSVLLIVLMGGVCPVAIFVATWRVNQKSISDDGYMFPMMIVWCAWTVASGLWALRAAERTIVPRKQRLEVLLKELDDQG